MKTTWTTLQRSTARTYYWCVETHISSPFNH